MNAGIQHCPVSFTLRLLGWEQCQCTAATDLQFQFRLRQDQKIFAAVLVLVLVLAALVTIENPIKVAPPVLFSLGCSYFNLNEAAA